MSARHALILTCAANYLETKKNEKQGMSTTWFTADTHLGHANIIKFCLRPFLSPTEHERALEDPRGQWRVSTETVQRHDSAIIDAINRSVQPQDTLWILGDFCWGKLESAQAYRERIECRNVHLIWGNHDHRSVEPVFGKTIEQCMLSIEGKRIWLNHYPMRTWHKSFHGSWQLYGHVHGRLMEEDQRTPWTLTRDVGVDACEYKPMSFTELQSYMEPREKAFAQHREKVLRQDEQCDGKFVVRGSLA